MPEVRTAEESRAYKRLYRARRAVGLRLPTRVSHHLAQRRPDGKAWSP